MPFETIGTSQRTYNERWTCDSAFLCLDCILHFDFIIFRNCYHFRVLFLLSCLIDLSVGACSQSFSQKIFVNAAFEISSRQVLQLSWLLWNCSNWTYPLFLRWRFLLLFPLFVIGVLEFNVALCRFHSSLLQSNVVFRSRCSFHFLHKRSFPIFYVIVDFRHFAISEIL